MTNTSIEYTKGCRRSRPPCRCAGTVLIVTLWIMLVLVGLVIVMARDMRVEGGASANYASALQAAAVQNGATQYVLAKLDGLSGRMPTEQEMPCEGVIVGSGMFWIIRGDQGDGRQTYGIVSEAGKINLNTATAEMLAELPEMTAELAAAIVDWRDEDGDLTPGGAESEYYLLLPQPYECKNGPLETVGEVKLIAGSSQQILFGEDANRNGLLDENENDSDQSDPPDNRNGDLDRGIMDFVTVYSIEPNQAADGTQRVDINDLNQLAVLLNEKFGESRALEIMILVRDERPFQNVLDFYVRTGMKAEEFETVADNLTTSEQTNIRGLLDLRVASTEAMDCLPGLDESDVASLISARPAADEESGNIAWVAKAIDKDKAAAVGSYITCRSYQFSADIVSVSSDGRAFKRCRIVVDARQSPPSVLYRQDMTNLGWPLSRGILEELRSGTPLEDVANGEYQETQ